MTADNDNIVSLLQQLQQRRWQQAEDYMRERGQTKQQLQSELFETLLGFARRHKSVAKHEWHVDDELEVLIILLVLYAGNAKVSGLSLLKRLCNEIDVCAGQCWTDDFADWFGAGVPQELMDYEDFEYYPHDNQRGDD
jgi:hypothetical protein